MGIQQVTVQQKRLSSAEAELLVYVHVDHVDESTMLRGGLVGPTCVAFETVQLNFPLKPIELPNVEPNVLVGRIIIPEPNFWAPERPLIYEGNVELWQAGRCVEIKGIRAAFRERAV
jgi:hypothetical protein